MDSERFGRLFPMNTTEEMNMNLRTVKKYKEEYARTERLYNSPLFAMPRYANENY